MIRKTYRKIEVGGNRDSTRFLCNNRSIVSGSDLRTKKMMMRNDFGMMMMIVSIFRLRFVLSLAMFCLAFQNHSINIDE